MSDNEVTFSIVTATYNAADVLPSLIKSLQAQTDTDFEWIVADGQSTDGTLELLEEASKILNVRVDSRIDFGIYDALNRAVKMANGEYYLVLGADDELFPDTVENYKDACCRTGADLVTAMMEVDGKVKGGRKRRWEWLYSQFAHVNGHSVSLVIRRSLHKQFGLYSRMYPIAADELFILQAMHGKAKLVEQRFVAGRFSNKGTSGQDLLGALTESARVRVHLGHNPWLQLLLLCVRCVKHRHRIVKVDSE